MRQRPLDSLALDSCPVIGDIPDGGAELLHIAGVSARSQERAKRA